MKVNKSSIKFYANATAVINQFLYLPGEDRVKNIIGRIKKFSETEVQECLAEVMKDFVLRHRDIETFFLENFNRVSQQSAEDITSFSGPRKKLLGAFLTKEYSIQAAALFNPSIVPHPDQQNLKTGEQRFVMSLRATGEGHISSIIFKTGIVDHLANIILDEGPAYFTSLKKTVTELYNGEPSADFKNKSEDFFDTNYDLQSSAHLPINEKVIFPNAKAERMGMEDVRFVKFVDEAYACYYGLYTAYDGKHIKTQLIETKDFDVFKIRSLYGAAVSDKGMALFPEKINGKYVITARQGGEKMSIMFSQDLFHWEEYQLLMEPKYPWELVQLGNCGSPIKTDKGWLLLTHGVGAMRTYVISAILLDLTDPTKIIGRLNKPLIQADESERDGYVPNVVYTCGLLRHGDTLIIPYAVSDSATGFATVDLNELLDEMKF